MPTPAEPTGLYQRNRNIVTRWDGRRVNVARFRGQLFVCSLGCCCGQTADGFAPVPAEAFHAEWERRRLRNVVHLTVGGCLGPCGLANVVLLLFDGRPQWFHSVNSPDLVGQIYDYIDALLATDQPATPGPGLASHLFAGFTWQPRPDGQPVDDFRPRRQPVTLPQPSHGRQDADMPTDPANGRHAPAAASQTAVSPAVASMDSGSALPRKNGELVFEEAWHSRAFGMAVALHERGAFEWEEFRVELIREIAEMTARGGEFVYYQAWLAALETVLARKGAVSGPELSEVTYQFEYGERDDVY